MHVQGNKIARTLTPGLFDAHVHLFMRASSQAEIREPKAAVEARLTFERVIMKDGKIFKNNL